MCCNRFYTGGAQHRPALKQRDPEARKEEANRNPVAGSGYPVQEVQQKNHKTFLFLFFSGTSLV